MHLAILIFFTRFVFILGRADDTLVSYVKINYIFINLEIFSSTFLESKMHETYNYAMQR